MDISALTPDIFLVLSIILITVILFVTEFVRADVVACLVLVLLGLTHLVPDDKLFAGFSSEAVISLIAIMIIGAGLERVGIVARVTDYILRYGGSSENKIRVLLMMVSGIFSGFLRSVGTVALLLPVTTRIRRSTGIAKGRLLMPISFCAILGSTLTMVGTGPLIILNSLLSNTMLFLEGQLEYPPIGLFAVFPLGVLLLLTGMAYFIFFGKWLLPNIERKSLKNLDSRDYFKRVYGIGSDFFEFRVPPSSSLADNTLSQWEMLLPSEIFIIGIKMGNSVLTPPLRTTNIKVGAVLACFGPKSQGEVFAKRYGIRMSPYLTAFGETLSPLNAGLCEAVIPPSSKLIGTDLKELHMRRQYGIQVLAVHRGQKVTQGHGELNDITLKAGDTLGMFCNWRALSSFEKNPDFIVATTDYPKEIYQHDKTSYAIFFFLLSIGLVIAGALSVSIGLMVGAVGMVFSGVISIDDAYEAVSWKTVFLIAGLIPLGIAVQTSGTSDLIASLFLEYFPGMPEWGLLFLLGVVSTIFSLFTTNVGATVILVPLAVQLAINNLSNPQAYALMVAIASSNSFILPTHQANALISGPGRYRVIDFVKVGGVMSILYLIEVVAMIQFMY